MDKHITLVCSETNFTVSAMLKTFQGEGFTVTRVPPNVERFDRLDAPVRTVVLYADGPASYERTFLKYLQRRTVGESPIQLYVVGNDNEMFNIFSVIDREDVAARYTKPVNVKELIADIFKNQDESPLPHILVVDDDGTMLRTIKEWLAGKYTVHMASSGMSAISFLAQTNVELSLILLDYEMPVFSGLKLFEILKNDDKTKDIPVIFLTAQEDRETVIKILKAKPDRYLLKSMPPMMLIKSIDDFFAERKAAAGGN